VPRQGTVPDLTVPDLLQRKLVTTHPGSSSPVKRLAFLRGRLNFANLTALLALFLALGGSSYAALSVGSEQIANNGVRSEDLRNNDVRGRDIRIDTVRGTDVRDGDLRGRDMRYNTLTGADVKESTLKTVPRARDAQTLAGKPAAAYLGTDAQTLAGKPASAFLGSDKQLRTGLIEFAHGETATFFSYGPFTWTAECYDGGGNTSMTVFVESSEPTASPRGPPDSCSPFRPAREPKCLACPTPTPTPAPPAPCTPSSRSVRWPQVALSRWVRASPG
jgi:hypothetical protein